MGFAKAFAYENPAQIFSEHAQLSGFENADQRAFDISALANLNDAQYDELQPVQWPVMRQLSNEQISPPHFRGRAREGVKTLQPPTSHPHPNLPPEMGKEAEVAAISVSGTLRLFENGQFFTPSGKARMIAVTPQLPATATDAEFPLVLNTGRIRDQWHTMTRTGKVPRLNAQVFETFVQIHPADAQLYQLQDGGLAQLNSRFGTMLARIQVSADQRIGSVFVPMHWSNAFAKSSRVDALVAPVTDPISGQPESKHTPVRVAAYQPAWQGFVLSRSRLEFTDASYCAYSQGKGFWRHEIAGDSSPADWRVWVRSSLANQGDWTEYCDAAMGRYRTACLKDGQLEAIFFIAPDQRLPEREWLGSLFNQAQLNPADRSGLLAACPPKGSAADCGKNVCACYGVGEKTILHAIQTQQLDSVESIGAVLKAGTGCGSCIPEIRRLIQLEVEDEYARP
jgi:assimilatory nitrate reductase catalytic subunit